MEYKDWNLAPEFAGAGRRHEVRIAAAREDARIELRLGGMAAELRADTRQAAITGAAAVR